jgi:hypothetical protein
MGAYLQNLVLGAAIAAISPMLTGCVGVQLKELEIKQLQAEIRSVRETSTFVAKQPALGPDFDAHIAIGKDVFNRFLAGLDRYDVPIENAFGAKLSFEQVRLHFRDGFPTAVINAKAVDGSGRVELKVQVRADILISAQPEKEQLVFAFLLREVVPELRWGDITFGRLLLVLDVLGIEGQKYIDSLPATTVPLKADLVIDVDPKDRARIEIGGAWIEVEQKLPKFKLAYVYRATQAVVLDDGVHLFFVLAKKE